jgi:hypothetical protein
MVDPVSCPARPLLAKKTGREGQQRRLRDELSPLRTSLAGVLGSLGTRIAQELPGLAKVLDDAAVRFRGGTGHGGGWLLSGVDAATDDRKINRITEE